MTRNLVSTIMLWLLCSILVFFCFVIVASAQETEQPKVRPAHVGFIFPLSTNGTEAPQQTNAFSFHILAGVSNQENAFCLSGISSVVRSNANGLMIAGISNHVGHNARGVQIAGVVNQVKGNAGGVQVAGLANVTGNAAGAQVAGFANIAKSAAGLQLAGFANTAGNSTTQVAGFANVAATSEAVQVAGFINVAGNTRTQVAGFINVAKKVSGAQVAGFINIAEESDYPIGLVNIIKKGEKQIGLTVDETGSTLLAFRSGGKVLYGIIGAGYNFRDDNARYVLEGGIGAHFPISRIFRTNMEIVCASLTDLQYDVYLKSSARLTAALKIANRIELFAGPTFNYLGYERGQDDIRDGHYLWKERGFNHVNGLYFGAIGGIQVNL